MRGRPRSGQYLLRLDVFDRDAWEPLELNHLTRVVKVTNVTDDGIVFRFLHVL